jgi:hypothetical protein
MNNLQPSLTASTIVAQEGATMNELIEMILKGDNPIDIIVKARSIDDTSLPEMKHVLSYVAGMTTSWARDNKEQALKEFRWELGYALMQLAYGEQPFKITPMERVK